MSDNQSQIVTSFLIPVEQDPPHSPEANVSCSVGSTKRSPSISYSRQSSHECLGADADPSESALQYYLEDDVDINQRTVTSFGGLSIDTQDSARYYDAPFDCGNIQFSNVHSQKPDIEPKRHYVCIPSDTSSWEVTQFLGTYWKMRSPKIVLSVISGVRHFKPWKNLRVKEQFQKAIIKAANTTEMWVVTSGLDGGVSKIIGDAFREERARRLSNRTQQSMFRPDAVQKFQKLTLIGILPKDGLKYGDKLDGSEGVGLKNEGHQPDSDKYELNPDHTHFMIVEEEDLDRMFFTNIRCTLEKEFEFQLGRPRRLKRVFSWGSDECNMNSYNNMYNSNDKTIPVIGLLVQGSPKNVEHILFYLSNKMPVVVLKGSGGFADLLAFAYQETQERTDPDFLETFLKPELIKLICKAYPNDFKDNDLARNEFRDKILQCVDLAQEEDQTFMTVVSMQGWDANLKDLDKYLLKALFKSEKQVASKWKEQLYKNLQLILDWNRPDLVQTQIFQRDDYAKIKLNKELLEKALLKTDREEFVDLFLDHGIQIHKFLNHKKFKLLFERAEDREFFTTVCLEGALNFSSVEADQPLQKEFLSNDLNRLINKLSGIKDFVQPYELSMNSAGLYVSNPAVAERKALNCLIIWAVLMNRQKLAKVLWQRCEEPIAMALICSNMYKELAKYCIELYLRTEMENNANDFGKIALGVLDISFRDSSAQAYNILCKQLPDFNNKTTLQIAHDANYMNFIAHPCCQKWLTKKLFGAIHVKEVHWGIFRLPYWFKILASVFLIFPMFIWINFSSGSLRRVKGITVNDSILMEDDDEEGESDSNDEEEDTVLPSSKSMLENELSNMSKKKGLKNVKVKIKSAMKSNKKKHLAIWRRIQLLWLAPITKFWLTQALYFVYLGVFCLAVLWPSCGNLTLDLVVWLWTAVILTELVRRTYVKHQKYKTGSLFSQCLEITLILIFLICFLFLRIIPHWFVYANINVAKTVMSMGLIYFFYRLLGMYLLISPTLGPMLVRMSRMVKHDFVAFIRMFLIFLISGGVTIQAVLYPHFPMGIDIIKKVLTRPLFAMFLTKIDDLDGTPACNAFTNANMSTHYCLAEPHRSESELPDHIEQCPVESVGGYLIVIQYLLICKLVLVTLLFAMFALTITKVDKEAGEIWKFQRYALIIDFEERLCLPPPFTLFCYFTMIFAFIYRQLFVCRKGCLCCYCCKRQEKKSTERMNHKVQRIKQSQDYNYWQKCASEYITTQQNEQEKHDIVNKQAEVINSIQEDMNFQKKNMRLLNNRIVDLEKIMLSSRMYLENIYHKLDKTDVFGVSNTKGQIIHITARQSPYPGTRIARFPVFDKYVPWEQAYDVYDPKIYTKPKEQFCEDEMVFVDEDLIQLKKAQEERDRMTEEEKEALPPLVKFSAKWNAVVTYRQESNTRAIDRRSWISFDNQPHRYSLDPMEIPINSMGRTGLRGRGVLWRWGPNHVIKAVCTRWRHKYSDNDAQTGFLYVEGKRVLEFIAIKKLGDEVTVDSGSTYGLPGGALHGHISPYSTQCQAFMKDVLMEDQEPKNNLDQSDMIQYFAQFAANVSTPVRTPVTQLPSPVSGCGSMTQISSIQPFLARTNSRTSLRTHGDGDSSGFSACLLYKGYVDDPRNTDNAWVEAEVWNFHYDGGDTFDIRIPEDSTPTWKEVSPNVKIFGNEGVIVQEAAKIHDAYH